MPLNGGEAFEQIAPNLFQQDPARALQLAELVRLAAEEFYRAFPQDRGEVARVIAEQIGTPKTELASTLTLRDEMEIALVGGTALSDLAAAQAGSTVAHIKSAGPRHRANLARHLRTYASQLEPVPPGPGLYIARVAVAPEHRGRGLGRAIMREYLARAGDVPVHLHVHRENAPAIALYTSLGFLGQRVSDLPYVLLIRAA